MADKLIFQIKKVNSKKVSRVLARTLCYQISENDLNRIVGGNNPCKMTRTPEPDMECTHPETD